VPATGYPTISNSTVVQAQHPIVSDEDYPIDRADRHQNSSAFIPGMGSYNIYPLVIAAHPLEPNQFVVG